MSEGPITKRDKIVPPYDGEDALPEPRVSVGRIVHYWTDEAGQLVPNAAMVVATASDGRRVHLHIFWAGGFGGNDRLWATWATKSTEGRWTWPERV